MPKIRSDYLREYFLRIKIPFVLKGYLQKIKGNNKWQSYEWSKKDWLKLLKNEKLNVRCGKIPDEKVFTEPQWESSCYKGVMEYSELLAWDQPGTFTVDSKTTIDKDKYWAYFDYFYMKDLKNMELADEILSWEKLGFPDVKAKDTTLWIGTAGSNTPCHMDTYGVNIVIQLHGTKKWTLFSPNDSKYMYAARLPYEESSVYSSVGFPNVNLKTHPKLANVVAHTITLEAGDILHVPHKWWHFVQSEDFAISVNTWLPHPQDHGEKLKEALIAYQAGMFCQGITSSQIISMLNPNMLDIATLSSSELLKLFIERYTHIRNMGLGEAKKLYVANPSNSSSDESDTNIHQSSGFSDAQNIYLARLIIKKIIIVAERTECGKLYSELNKSFEWSKDLAEPDPNPADRFKDVDFAKVLFSSLTDDRVISVLKTVIEENIENK